MRISAYNDYCKEVIIMPMTSNQMIKFLEKMDLPIYHQEMALIGNTKISRTVG